LSSLALKEIVQVVANNGNTNYKHFFAQTTMCCWAFNDKNIVVLGFV
jgi:hypothetical protein